MEKPSVYVLARFPSGEMIEWSRIPISKLSLLLRIVLKRGATNVITRPCVSADSGPNPYNVRG